MFGMLYAVSSASFLIALREGFEAAVAVAVGAGLILHVTIDGLNGLARSRTFAAICIAAGALLTWMIFWMKKNSRHLKHDLEGKANAAMAESSALGLAMVAFLAVVREGLETALFLISASTTDSGRSTVLGTVAGLVVAGGLGVVIYQGAHRFDMKRFFQITGALIIVFAAGLVSKAVLFLQGNTVNVVYNVNGIHWLTGDSEVGKFLTGIFGWDPAPSALQFAGYWLYLVPALVFFFWTRPARNKTPTPSAPADESTLASTPVPVS
jgi:high-affinity iron transporter